MKPLAVALMIYVGVSEGPTKLWIPFDIEISEDRWRKWPMKPWPALECMFCL